MPQPYSIVSGFVLAGLLLAACGGGDGSQSVGDDGTVRWDTLAAEVFGESILNTENYDEYGPVLTAGGDTLFFVRRVTRDGPEHIVVAVWDYGTWSYPSLAPFSGYSTGGVMHSDKEPFLSPDGRRLFFASDRPVDENDLGYEIWYVARTAGGWSDPRHVAALGSPGVDSYPAVAASGTMYFASERAGGAGRNDLYRAVWADGQYQPPELLTTLNTPASDADPYIDPAERFMIFSSTRDGGWGEGDLYITYAEDDGWSAPVPLNRINTAAYEYTPFLSLDGQFFYFSRDWGTMLRVPADSLAVDLPG